MSQQLKNCLELNIADLYNTSFGPLKGRGSNDIYCRARSVHIRTIDDILQKYDGEEYYDLFLYFFNYINVNSTILQIFRNVRLQTKKNSCHFGRSKFCKIF